MAMPRRHLPDCATLATPSSPTRRGLLLGGAALAGAALAGCDPRAGAGPDSPPPGERKPVTLQFWPRWTAQFQLDGLKSLLAAYQERAPEVTVEMTPHGAQYEKIIAAVSGGTSPDVTTLNEGVIGRFALRKVVQPLDGLLARSKTAGKEVFFPAQLQAASWTGQVYGLPAFDNGPSPFLFWNQALFEEGGLDARRAPDTLDQARLHAEKLTRRAPDGGIVRLGFDPLAEAAGDVLSYWASAFEVSWYDPQNRKITLDQPALLEAMTYVTDLYRRLDPPAVQAFRQQFPQWNGAQSGMAQGVEAMKVSTYVSAGTLANNAPAVPLSVGWAPTKAGKPYVTFGAGHYISVPGGAPQADAAHRFIEFVVSPAANQIIFDTIGWLGFNREVARSLNPGKVDNLQFILQAPAAAQRVRGESSLPISTAPVNEGVRAVAAGQVSARAMLQETSRRLQAELDEALRSA